MSKINFNDKVENGGANADGKVSASNMNEIKTSVNAVYDIINTTSAKFITVNTYALLLSITPSTQLIIVKVLNDENKSIQNSIYHIYPDGIRMWIAANQDN